MSHFKMRCARLFQFFVPLVLGCTLLFYVGLKNGVGVWLVSALFVVALLLIHRYFSARIDVSHEAQSEVLKETQLRAGLYLNTIESLAIAIDAKDQTTHGHVHRTQVYATELGRLLCVSHNEHEALKAGALLHDIGKLAVPEYILNKPEKLTKAESAKIKIHPTVGADILSRVNFPFPVEDIVRHHHERWDGTGYPKGLEAENIPLVARIISVVDFYDATRCDRPFRAGMKRDESLALLSSMAGTSFDPNIVEMFAAHVTEFDRLISPKDLDEQVPADDAIEQAIPLSAEYVSLDNNNVRDRNEGFRSIAEVQREVYALHEIAQTIGSSLSLHDTVALVSSKLHAIIPFDTCVIYLIDEDAGQAYSAHVSGEFSDSFRDRRMNIGDGISGWVIASGKTIGSSSPESDLSRIPESVAGQIRNLLVAPLKRDDGVFGAISLYSKSTAPYSPDHIRLLEVVSQHVSGAINNSLTYEKTKERALCDPLTDLPNARAFYMALEQRIAEGQRLKNREPITVMSMNLDDFRRVNESFGHATGDRLLKSVSATLKNQLRQMDVLARYDGDEFIAILPMASHKTAYIIAERIHSAIQSHNILAQSECEIELGISIGVASHPDDGDTAGDLLAIARRNMQHDKRARKFAPTPIDSSFASINSFGLQ